MNDEHLKGIGRIAVEHGELEWLIDNLLMWLIDRDETALGAIVCTRFSSIRNQLSLVDDLMVYRYKTEKPDLLNRWKRVSKRVERAGEERNELMHGAWKLEDKGSPELLTKLAKRGRAPRKLTSEEINGIAVSIAMLNTDLTAIVIDVLDL